MRIAENMQEKFSNPPRKSANVSSFSRKVRVGKRNEEKKEDDVVSLRGDLEKANEALAKAQEAMGMAKKAMTQVNTLHPIARRGIHMSVTHTAGRIPLRIFTRGSASRVKESEKKKGKQGCNKSMADTAHGSAGQPSRPSVWERIQILEPLHLAKSYEPLMKFVNSKKLVMSVDNARSQMIDNNKKLGGVPISGARPRREMSGDDESRKSIRKRQNRKKI